MASKKQQKMAQTIIMMIVGAGVGFLSARAGLEWASSMPSVYLLVVALLFIPIFFLVIGVHEAGHAVAGLLVRFDLRMYVVGPLMWEKQDSVWNFKWNKNVNLSGGLVICLPTSTENLASRFSLYALGGPFASLLLAGSAYLANQWVLSISSGADTTTHLAAALFGVASFLSITVFAVTMIPIHTGGFYTDGARALRFLRGGDTSRFETLLMKIVTSSSAGQLPRREEIREALTTGEKLNAPMKVYLHFYLYQVCFHENNFDEAETHLKNYLHEVDSIPAGMRGSVFLDATMFYAIARRDLPQAEFYWNQYQPSAIIPKAQVLTAEAAILSLRDERSNLVDKVELALQALPAMLDRGTASVYREKLNGLKKINARQFAN